jgi:lysophospholipase L1-like esterase/CRP-like cAMP-binding protein
MSNNEKRVKSVLADDLLSYFDGDSALAAYFAATAEWVTVPAETTLVRQFDRADFLYLLVEGHVAYGVQADDSSAFNDTGDVTTPWTPIGWSGLGASGRYSTTARTRTASKFVCWRTPEWWRQLYTDPRRAVPFIERVIEGRLAQLEAARHGIRPFRPVTAPGGNDALASGIGRSGVPARLMFVGERADAAAILSLSSFFRDFTESEKDIFTEVSRFLRVRSGDRVMLQGDHPDGLYVLARGRVALKFRSEGNNDIVTRTIGRSGTVCNWHGITRTLETPFTVEATRDTVLLFVPGHAIAKEASRNPEFGVVYAQRELWLLSQFLLSAQTRLISAEAENEILAVSTLIDQKSTEIPVRSSLYKIPHLLRHPDTREDAFHNLHQLVTSGTPLERSLAGLQLDILSDLERETWFRERLAYIYERVAGADPSATRASLLQESAEAMRHTFEEVPYVIEGMENFPDHGGFIVVYNHLAGYKEYKLPNNHEFTLDSHFVSSLLMRRFGTPGLRVVKNSDSGEFWHRGYFGRILTIQVSTGQSPTERARYYQTVQNTLDANTPVVIAPEGTNNTVDNLTESSPGPFRPGAFALATRMNPEPWIVPIALANFDKSIRNSVYAAVVKPPFRMSDQIADPTDRSAIAQFVKDYRRVFRGYVVEALDLANAAREGAGFRGNVISNLGRLNWLESEFADDVHQVERRVRTMELAPRPAVFYGSSSFRMWETLGQDLDLPNVLNLGFGGSTLEACAHFFERLVVPHDPSALVVYAGDNDVGNGATADQVTEHFRVLLLKADQFLPGIPIYLLSIKPSPFREAQLDTIVRANRGISDLAASQPNLHFIDVFTRMLKPDGTPDAALFKEDMLHMNENGYALWTAALQPTAQTIRAAA